MRAERKRQIREAVLHDMAPAYAGQVSLEDVSRTFRGRGGLKEVEECLNDLVNEGLARKTEVSGRPYYLFEARFLLVQRIIRGKALHSLSGQSSRLRLEKQRCPPVFRQVSSGPSFFLARM